jgi:hypothetical protein
MRSWRISPLRPQRGHEIMEDIPAAAAAGIRGYHVFEEIPAAAAAGI